MHLLFLTSHNLLFFRFCKTSKKNIFGFLSFFVVKSPKSQSLKLNISRTAWPILMILVSFRRILNGLSDEINLFWRCSSPLTSLHISIYLQSTAQNLLQYVSHLQQTRSKKSIRFHPKHFPKKNLTSYTKFSQVTAMIFMK